MSAAQGDYIEVYTWGYFNNQSEAADLTAISTDGYFRGVVVYVMRVITMLSRMKEKITLRGSCR